MKTINWDKLEKEHLISLSKQDAKIRALYTKMYRKVTQMIEQGHTERVIMRFVEKEVKKLSSSLTLLTKNAMNKAVKSSFEKNNAILLNKGVSKTVDITRINIQLSPKLWKLTENLIEPIKEALKSGIPNTELAKSLVEMVDTTAKGRGIYKDPIKNAQRVARNEINTAYRENDEHNWNQIDFVIGKEIRLSNSPKKLARCEICRGMAGRYPKNFKWSKWHVNCLCSQIPIMLSDEDFKKWEEGLLDKKPTVEISEKNIDWVRDNSYRFAKWKQEPDLMVNFKDI